MTAYNISRQTLIAKQVRFADSPWARMKGLLGRDSLNSDEGLLITCCNSIHMFFMRFSIDAIFLDRNNSVVGLVCAIPPFSLSPVFWNASKVLELSSGTIKLSGTELNDKIEIS
jgi:uncharacterized membrane protein (UPF0127 family)